MNWKKEMKILALMASVFAGLYFLPVGNTKFNNAVLEALELTKWYAREHVLLCLVPAFLIAGAISAFVSQASVMKYLGAKAKKVLAYGVASVSGSVLAVCSCTVLPLFSGIYKMGAGLGPATAFLYSGPAINVLAIILTARVLGFELGVARAVGAVSFSIVIGLLMHFIFHKEEMEKVRKQIDMPVPEVKRSLFQNSIYFLLMVGILVFANFGHTDDSSGIWFILFTYKWYVTAVLLVVFLIHLAWGFRIDRKETVEWFGLSWGFAKQILPLLFIGVLVAGFLLGRPGMEGMIPSDWIYWAVGGNSFFSNLFASISGAFMYFATLTEVPILHGLMGNGMGKGPALALLLAGPALSLPNMLVIRNVMGTKKTVAYVFLVVVMSTITGYAYGLLF